MTYINKFIISFIFLCLLKHSSLLSYPILGEFYQAPDNHTILILVDSKEPANEQSFKSAIINPMNKILSDSEITLILKDRLEQLSNVQNNIKKWDAEFESDPQWQSIINQNYSENNASTVYKNVKLDPKSTTKLFVLISKMKNYIEHLPLKDHLNFIRKNGINNENNLYKSCRSARDYFQLSTASKTTACTIVADWRTPVIATITRNYRDGLEALSRDLHLVNKESWSQFVEDLARAFVPQDPEASQFKPLDKFKIKDLLDDLELVLKKLEQLEVTTSNNIEKELWSYYKARMKKAKDYILNGISIYKNLSIENKQSFEQLFKEMPKYQYTQLHWFAIIYAYLLNDNNDYSPEAGHEWLEILTQDLAHMSLMSAVLDSKNKQTKAFMYLDQESHKVISDKLLTLGYSKKLAFNSQTDDNAIKTSEIQLLINQFPVNMVRIKQLLQKPLMCSFRV